jgi:hypothetical protein
VRRYMPDRYLVPAFAAWRGDGRPGDLVHR